MTGKKAYKVTNEEFYFLLSYKVLLLSAIAFLVLFRQFFTAYDVKKLLLLGVAALWTLVFAFFGRKILEFSQHRPWVTVFDTSFAFMLSWLDQPTYSLYLLYALSPIIWLGTIYSWKAGVVQAVATIVIYISINIASGLGPEILNHEYFQAAVMAYSSGALIIAFFAAFPLSILKQLRIKEQEAKTSYDAFVHSSNELLATEQTLVNLHRVNVALQSVTNLDELEDMVLELLTTRFLFSWGAVLFLDKSGKQICCTQQLAREGMMISAEFASLEGHDIDDFELVSRSITQGQLILVSPTATNAPEDRLTMMLKGQRYALIPMVAMKRGIGVLAVGLGDADIRNKDLEHVRILAGQAAVAFSNIELNREQDDFVSKLLSMYQAIEKMTLKLKTNKTITIAIDQMRKLTNTEKAIITLVDPQKRCLTFDPAMTFIRGCQHEHPESWWKEKLSQNAQLISNAKDPIILDFPNESLLRKAKIICVPLIYGRRFYGLMASIVSVDSKFDNNDMMIISILARFTAIAIENTRLLERTQQLILMNERNRIARDIHDGLAQSLFSIVLNIEVCSKLLETSPQSVKERLQDLQSMTSTTLKEVREYIYDLRPGNLDEMGLPLALESFLLDFCSTDQIEINYKVEGTQYSLMPAAERSLYYIGKEAVVNAMKHSMANEINVSLQYRAKDVLLSIIDDGIGFDVEQALNDAKRKGSLGLSNIKERIDQYGGKHKVISKKGAGAKVIVSIPRSLDSAPANKSRKVLD